MLDLDMDVERIRRVVEASEADAWLVIAAPHHVLEWFAEQTLPAFALFGRRAGVRIAGVGPDHVPPIRAVVRRLVALGHRRIVILDRWGARGTGHGRTTRGALEEMEKHGLQTGAYNMPADGVRRWRNGRTGTEGTVRSDTSIITEAGRESNCLLLPEEY